MFQNSDPLDPVFQALFTLDSTIFTEKLLQKLPMVNHSFMGHGPKKKTYEIPCSPTLSGAASSYAPAPGRRLHCSAPAGRGTKEYKLAPVLVRQIIGKQCLGNFFLWIVATLLEPSRCGLAMLGERSKHANGSRHQGTSKPIWLMPRPMVIPGLKTS